MSSLRSKYRIRGGISDPPEKKCFQWVGGRLTKVRYLSDENSSAFDAAVDSLLALAPQLEGRPTFNGPMTANGFVIAWFSVMASTFKHGAFRTESEWRILLTKPHKPMAFQRFRPGKSAIVPFVEAILNRDLHSGPTVPSMIKEVRVSPTPDPSLSVDALKALFLSMGHPEVEVNPLPSRFDTGEPKGRSPRTCSAYAVRDTALTF